MEQYLSDISNGKLYGKNDMVRVGCRDCRGCSECCHGMGDSILLDPYDIYRLGKGLNQNFEEMLQGPVELHMEEGLILPNLKMADQSETGRTDSCFFLNREGRCSIHSFRPGICRLFPLGRNYEQQEDGSYRLSYFLLEGECPVPNKSKMKVSKWLDTPNLKEYEDFLQLWHQVTKHMREELTANPDREETSRKTSMLFLQYFYQKPYTKDGFFEEFRARAQAVL